jgi:hypothetical protein
MTVELSFDMGVYLGSLKGLPSRILMMPLVMEGLQHFVLEIVVETPAGLSLNEIERTRALQ